MKTSETMKLTTKDIAKVNVGALLGTAIGKKPDQEPPAPAPAPAEAAKATPMIIKVLKKDGKYRGAREAWYKAILEHDGKTLDEFCERTKEHCPQMTKNGTKEPPMGWVGFFKREGIISVTPKA